MVYPRWERPFAFPLPRGYINLGWKQGARPLIDRGGRDAFDILLDQVPADGLRQEGHWRVAHEHGLCLPELLIATVRLRVHGSGAHEVVVLRVLIQADVAKARRQKDRVPIRGVGIVGGPAARTCNLKIAAAEPRVESVGVKPLEGDVESQVGLQLRFYEGRSGLLEIGRAVIN